MKHMENQEHVKELVTEEMKEFTELEKRILAGKETYQRIPVPEEMEQRIDVRQKVVVRFTDSA